jgi:signal transduction histidine kinase
MSMPEETTVDPTRHAAGVPPRAAALARLMDVALRGGCLRPAGRYAVAIGLVATAVVIKSLVAPIWREAPFLLLTGATLLAAWFGGRGPALVALALATAAADFILPPFGSFRMTHHGAVQIAAFAVEASVVSALAIAMKEARARAEESAARIERDAKQLLKLNRAHRALSTSNQVLVHARDEEGLLQEICRVIVEVAGYRMCWVGRVEHDEAKTVRPIAVAGHEEGYLTTVNVTWSDTERGCGPTGTAIRTGRPSVQQGVAIAPTFAPWRAEALKRGYASMIAVPLCLDGRMFGALNIYASEAEAFDEDAVRLLVELAADLAYGITSLRTRARVEIERARFASVLMQAPIAVGVCSGPDHVVRLSNPRWLAIGGTAAVPVGRPLREVCPEAVWQGIIPLLDEVYATGEPREVTEQPIDYRRASGAAETHFCNVAYQPLREADGSIEDILVLVSDVTEQVAARRSIEDARGAAEQASRAKDEFLRIASHELRTPLTPIVGWAQLLKKNTGRDPKQLERGLDAILGCARAEARLVEDLIDVSRIVAGKLRMELGPIELGPLVQACVEEMRPAAAAKGVEVEASIAADTALGGDARRLQQVARNLLSNALKFTPRGGRISVEITREDESLALKVSDTGKGIPAGELPHLFEHFHAGDRSTTRTEGGLGLGLSIVRYIVEAHEGTVRAESAGPGHGATLVAELRVAPRVHVETSDHAPLVIALPRA